MNNGTLTATSLTVAGGTFHEAGTAAVTVGGTVDFGTAGAGTLSGGTLTAQDGLTVNGGTVTLSGSIVATVTDGATVSSGSLAVNGGSLAADTLTVSNSGAFSEGGGGAAVTVSGLTDFSGGTGTISAGTFRTGSLTVDGGALTVAGDTLTDTGRGQRFVRNADGQRRNADRGVVDGVRHRQFH